MRHSSSLSQKQNIRSSQSHPKLSKWVITPIYPIYKQIITRLQTSNELPGTSKYFSHFPFGLLAPSFKIANSFSWHLMSAGCGGCG